MLQEMHPHLFLLMELTLGLWNQQNLIPNSGHTNSTVPVCETMLEFVFALETLFGLVVGGGLPYGECPDFLLARNAILDALQPEKKIMADRDYNDPIILTFLLEM